MTPAPPTPTVLRCTTCHATQPTGYTRDRCYWCNGYVDLVEEEIRCTDQKANEPPVEVVPVRVARPYYWHT